MAAETSLDALLGALDAANSFLGEDPIFLAAELTGRLELRFPPDLRGL